MSVLLVAAGCHTGAAVGRRTPRAVLVEGDRIRWVGDDPTDAPRADHVADLGGAWLTPAFVDAHVHATATGLAMTGLDLAAATSAADLLTRVRRFAAAASDEVILGYGWDDFGWPEAGPPTAQELTDAAGGRTVLLERADAHSCLVDTGTLRRLALADVAGVEVDARREPTGWLREAASESARMAVHRALPRARLDRARRAAAARAAALGIGCIHEMGHPGLSGLDDAQAWADGRWSIEVLVWWADMDPWLSGAPPVGLRPGGDLFLDGSIGSQTAAVSCGYPDGGTGELFFDEQTVTDFFLACTRSGTAAGAHAIGDRAIGQALAALDRCANELGIQAVRGCGHRLEHVELPTRGQIRRLGALGVIASMQPAFDARWGGDDGLYAARFGVSAARASNPLRPLAQAGAVLAFGSDSTVTPMGPWAGVAAAVRHRGGLGVTAEEALRAHTVGGRRAGGQDGIGTVAAGQRADLAVWDGDPMPELGATCLATVVGGETAFGSIDGLPTAVP